MFGVGTEDDDERWTWWDELCRVRSAARLGWLRLTWPLVRHKHNRGTADLLIGWAEPLIDYYHAEVIVDRFDFGTRLAVGLQLRRGDEPKLRDAYMLSSPATETDLQEVRTHLETFIEATA